MVAAGLLSRAPTAAL